jgi:hypothetical protein
VRDEGVDELRGGLERREVAGEAMVVVDPGERLVHDARGLRSVVAVDRPQQDGRGGAGGVGVDRHATKRPPGSGALASGIPRNR